MSAQTALPPDHDPLPPIPDSGALEPKKKKHKTGTLRRALSWLRGRKKKKSEAKLRGSKDNPKPDDDPQPIAAQENESPDNAFFPIGRTPLLEEIHNQAQEGLKSLQRREKQQYKHPSQEEENIPEPTPDTNDGGFRTRSLSCTTENTDDTMSVRSEMIQRKGSTFKPHDSPRTPSNRTGRRRKEKRATVVGVPQHIAAELGLHSSYSHRGIHELFPRGNNKPGEKSSAIPVANGFHGEKEEFVVIPTVDGTPATVPHGGAYISLVALEQTEAALQRHINKVYQDDSCIGRKSDIKMSPLFLRPKSLAVPGMTTHSPQSDPRSPVMSISPQATYMSKIIPNAVLPPMVDVVALSRSSVRTLSRCSLATASPASVRGSLHRGRGRSSSSDTWSRSQSTETIVSDSSTISSRGGENILEAIETHESGLSTGRTSPAPSTGTQDGSDAVSLCSGRSSVRSVSLRKSKKAPPPPKRTYSLQQQREMGLPPRPDKKPTTKTSNARDPWVLRTDKGTVENDVFLPSLAGTNLSSPSRSDRTLSPSSGYSSQSGTPTLPVRSLLESPGSRRKTPPKPERTSLKSASSMPMSSSSSTDNNTPLLFSPPRAGSSLGDQEGQDLIPPHPNVPAPSCPPPSKATDLVVTPAATPTPSPPPSHHPTPPPARKSESDTEIVPLTLEKTAQKESLWPPPPPETSDVQDLSMADFPPPDEEIFLSLPPSFESVCDSLTSSDTFTVITNDKIDVLEAEMPVLTSKNEKPLNIVVGPQPESVPLTLTESPDTAIHALVIKTASTSVTQVATEIPGSVVPPSTEPLVVPPAFAADSSLTTAVPSIIYKPHFITPSTATIESKKTLEATVPQKATGDPTVTTLESKVSTTSFVPTISSTSVESSVSIVSSSVIATNVTLPQEAGSPRPKSSMWKPASAPSYRKQPATNQSTAAAQKEDANLPIVTPSLLQMVRLRSVQARGPQVPSSHHLSGLPAPQKPVRKSLSLRSPQGSESSPAESPTVSPQSPHKPPDSPSAYRSPASAASFVFARGSKKFVFEPLASQEAESSLKRDLVEELKSHGVPRSPDGKPPLQKKPSKIPPPVARKPSVGIPRTPTSPANSTVGTNGSVFTPCDAGCVPPASGVNATVTQAGHEKPHTSQLEQA
ncbi:NHS-like protein 3 [Mixophyes fleayi]|uniref:NHS-like protein 3 n=1 Tax=Mixophyes fleayi TaxID=3061075 RepID=UPI003F4D73C7